MLEVRLELRYLIIKPQLGLSCPHYLPAMPWSDMCFENLSHESVTCNLFAQLSFPR